MNYLVASGAWSDNGGQRTGATSLPSQGGSATTRGGQLQFVHSRFVKSALSETQISANRYHSRSEPYLFMPSGAVRVAATLPDGTGGVATLRVGGSARAN